jgi:hypothetical protein
MYLNFTVYFNCTVWSSSHSSWLQIQRSGFDSRCYKISWEVVGLDRGSFSFVSKIEELLGRNNSGSGLETREYGRRNPLRWSRDTLYPRKLALTSPKSCGLSVGIVRSRTWVTEFSFNCTVYNVHTLCQLWVTLFPWATRWNTDLNAYFAPIRSLYLLYVFWIIPFQRLNDSLN